MPVRISRASKPHLVRAVGSTAKLRPTQGTGPQGPEGPPGPPGQDGAPGGSDAGTAAFVADPASDTRDALNGAIDQQVNTPGTPTHDGLSATFASRIRLSDLTTPYTIVHAGTSDVVVGHTMEQYLYAWNGGFPLLDLDARVLADATLANIHNDTVDAITTATGAVNTYTGLDFPTLTVDAAAIMGADGYPNSKTTLISDVLRQFGTQALYTIEAKDGLTSTVQKIVDLAASLRLTEQVIPQCVNLGALAPGVAAGMTTLQVTDTPDVAAVQAAGVSGVVFSNAASDANITAAVSAGLIVWVYGVNRRYEHDHYTNLGVHGIFSNNPIWSSGTFPRLTTDLFERKVWLPGHIMGANSRGQFVGTDRWGFQTAGTRTALAGFLSPITATSYTIEFDLTFDKLATTVSRYASIHICEPDDRPYFANDSGRGYADGYEIRFQQQGYINALKTVRSPASSTGIAPGTVAMGAGAAAGDTQHYKITVSPAQIVISRTGTGANTSTYTITDTAFRGGYLHFGKFDANEDMRVSFSNIAVA